MVNQEISRGSLAAALWAVRANYPHGVARLPRHRWALVIAEPEGPAFWSSEHGKLLGDIIGKALKTSREQVALIFAAGSKELLPKLAALDSGSSWSIIVFSKNYGDHPFPANSIITDDLATLAKDREAKKLFWGKLRERL